MSKQYSLQDIREIKTLKPAGISAANRLGLTTQNCIHGNFSTSLSYRPSNVVHPRAWVIVGRPKSWDTLDPYDAALLNCIRDGFKWSEYSLEVTTNRLLQFLKEGDRLQRILDVLDTEPSEVCSFVSLFNSEIRDSNLAYEAYLAIKDFREDLYSRLADS